MDGLLQIAFVCSTVAHAIVRSVDTSAAEAMPGVVGVFTAATLGAKPGHAWAALNDACARPPLADGKVRFVGDCVAAVVAESRSAATDAAEAVDVDYDPLPAVTDMEAALEPGAPLQFEELGSNLAAGRRGSNGEDPLADADVVVRGRFENQRVAVMPMEGNAIAVVPGDIDGGDDYDVTVYLSTQMPHLFADLASKSFGIPRERIRVIAPHVGGGFGAKAGLASEHVSAIAID